MKKFAVLLLFAFIVSASFAQKKNGTVYIEHDAIDKIRAMWKAWTVNDKAAVKSFFADSVMVVRNGNEWRTTAENFSNSIGWWDENIIDLKVTDTDGAYPDAIEYGDGHIWVQDWITISGIHEKTGIAMDLQMHNLYSFNDDGKVRGFFQYYNNNVFEDIRDAQTTKENGKVYINHPYIATVRKLVNAYAAEDLETLVSFYDKNARFNSIEYGWDNNIDLETRKKGIEENFANAKDIHFKQIGYPDCIYYQLNDGYTVYSWWEYSFTMEETGKKVVMPLLLDHAFNADGKIVRETAYYSTNHFTEE